MSYATITPIDLTGYMQEFPEHTAVVPAFVYSGLVEDYFHGAGSNHGRQLPWSKAHGKVGFRPGETTLWAGFNGSGKSLLVGQVLLEFLSRGDTACVASMEMKPEMSLARMCRQASGVNIPSSQFIGEFHDWLTERLWLYTQQNSVKHNRIVGLARYCGTGVLSAGKKVRMDHLVLDSLMKCGIGVDDYNTQKQFINDLCSIAKDTGTHIHLVAHMRKGDSEFRESDKMDIKGASELSDQADNVMIFWRNKAKEDESVKPSPSEKIMQMPDAVLSCRKQRNGEWEGKIALWFDKKSTQYVAYENARPIDFIIRDDEASSERQAIQQA